MPRAQPYFPAGAPSLPRLPGLPQPARRRLFLLGGRRRPLPVRDVHGRRRRAAGGEPEAVEGRGGDLLRAAPTLRHRAGQPGGRGPIARPGMYGSHSFGIEPF